MSDSMKPCEHCQGTGIIYRPVMSVICGHCPAAVARGLVPDPTKPFRWFDFQLTTSTREEFERDHGPVEVGGGFDIVGQDGETRSHTILRGKDGHIFIDDGAAPPPKPKESMFRHFVTKVMGMPTQYGSIADDIEKKAKLQAVMDAAKEGRIRYMQSRDSARAVLVKEILDQHEADVAFQAFHEVACPMLDYAEEEGRGPCPQGRRQGDVKWDADVGHIRTNTLWRADRSRPGTRVAFDQQTCRDAYDDFVEWAKSTTETPQDMAGRVKTWLAYEAACARAEEAAAPSDPLQVPERTYYNSVAYKDQMDLPDEGFSVDEPPGARLVLGGKYVVCAKCSPGGGLDDPEHFRIKESAAPNMTRIEGRERRYVLEGLCGHGAVLILPKRGDPAKARLVAFLDEVELRGAISECRMLPGPTERLRRVCPNCRSEVEAWNQRCRRCPDSPKPIYGA